jgi:hypothetical protein
MRNVFAFAHPGFLEAAVRADYYLARSTFLQRPLFRVFKWTEHQFRDLRARLEARMVTGHLCIWAT